MITHRPLFVLAMSLLALIVASCAQAADRAPGQPGGEQPPRGADLVYSHLDERPEVDLIAADSGKLVRTIPWGAVDPATSLVHRIESRDGKSVLRTFDDTTGSLKREHALAGPYTYELPLMGAAFGQPIGLSPNGRWLAVRARGVDYVTKSAFLVLDVETGAATPVELAGNFSFDALSNSGTLLYLEEHLPARDPTGYRVRAYDLLTRSLLEGVIVDKTVQVDQMRGTRVATVASGDGEWVHSLYLDYDGGKPFVHSLNLTGRYTVCLFPPAGSGNTEEAFGWGIFPAPDGRTAYVVNVIQGVAIEMDLREAKFRRTVTFKSSRAPDLLDALARWFVPVAEAKSEMFAQGVISPDGKTLYALGEFGKGIYVIPTDTLVPSKRLTADVQMLTGLALSADGRFLYTTDEGRSLIKLDLRSGTIASVVRAGAPLGRLLRVTTN